MSFLKLRSAPSGPAFVGETEGATLLWSVVNQGFYVGALDSDDVENASGVAGDSVSDALDTLQTEIDGIALGQLTAAWFVDAGAAPGGDGSAGFPFRTFAEAIAAAQDDFDEHTRDQTIVLVGGDYQASGAQTLTLDASHSLLLSGWATPRPWLSSQPLLPPVVLVAGSLVADGIAWVGVTPPEVDVQAGDVSANGCYFQSVQCDRFRATNCQVQAGTFLTSADLVNSPCGNLTVPTCRIRATRNDGVSVITGDLQIDSTSNTGAFSATGQLSVIGRPAMETASVVVPAVLAGQVGYADAIMAGQLGNVPSAAPVIANPTVDLVAAGAGGAYVNCRVVSPGVVRLAFVGPLAGGAVDFNFAAFQIF